MFETSKIINLIQKIIDDYIENQIKIIQKLNLTQNVSINICNERSVANHISYNLFKKMEDLNFITEFSINANTNIVLTQNQVYNDTGLPMEKISGIKLNGQIFIPDLCVADKDKNIYFVEFKIDGTFKYLSMIKDYVKYLKYMSLFKSQSVFVFIFLQKIMDKNVMIPSLFKQGGSIKPHIIDSKNTIANEIDENESIMIIKNVNENKIKIDEIDKIESAVDKIIHIDDQLIDLNNTIEYKSDIYDDKVNEFGKNVIVAKRIIKCKSIIATLIDNLNNNDIHIEYTNDSNSKIEEVINGFNNIIKSLSFDKKEDNNDAGFKISIKRSVLILALFQIISDKINAGLNFSEYCTKPEKKDFDELKNNLSNLAKSEYKTININELGIHVLYFVYNFYEKVELSIVENELVYSKSYNAYRLNIDVHKNIANIYDIVKLDKYHLKGLYTYEGVIEKIINKLLQISM